MPNLKCHELEYHKAWTDKKKVFSNPEVNAVLDLFWYTHQYVPTLSLHCSLK